MPNVTELKSENKLSNNVGGTTSPTPKINEYYRHVGDVFRVAKYITLLALVAFLIFSFTFMRRDITLENLRYLMKYISFTNTETSITVPKINYASGDPNRLNLFVGDLVTLTTSGYSLYDSRGNQIMAEDINYKAPHLEVSKRFTLCWDLGGNSFTVLNTFAKLHEETCEYPINDASISDLGSFAIATSSREYRTLVTLYDEDFKPISRIYKTDYLTAVEYAPDGSNVAIMTFGAENGSFYTRIELVVPGEERSYRKCEIDGIGYSLYYTDNGFVAVTDEATCFFDSELVLLASKPHSTMPVMTDCSGKYYTRMTPEGLIGNSYICDIFTIDGKLVYSGTVSGKLAAVKHDDSGEYIYILSGTTLTRVNLYNKKVGEIEVEEGGFNVLVQSVDSFLLAKKNYAMSYERVDFGEKYYDRSRID